MNPVIGLDISKGQSAGLAFLNKGQPYGRSFRFLHTLEGFKGGIIQEVRSKAGSAPAVILESTGHYHQAVIQFLESHEILNKKLR
jgi:transposase